MFERIVAAIDSDPERGATIVAAAQELAQKFAAYRPRKSPWLNPSAPKWLAGTTRVVEPTRLLSAHAREERVWATSACPLEPHRVAPCTGPAALTPPTGAAARATAGAKTGA